ncbi:MAG: FAD-dependent oxidoreductase [Acidobacteria bacterium]|nr:FAD-dependent oxidoreductase [Acidobacteriota bacterium]
MSDVVIVGGGLAGLTCARRLQARGRTCLVLEAGEAVGGRVRTDRVDGFQLDHGFQVLLTAYPAAQRWLDYDALALRRFSAGARVWCDGAMHVVSDPTREPGDLLATMKAPVGTLADKMKIATLRSAAREGTLDDLFTQPETTALEALQAHGFSPTMIERFLRPWLGGIFLDESLAASSRMLMFVLRMFAEGHAAVPEAGMQAIPEHLAAGLAPGTVRLGAPVAAVGDGGVTLQSGERISAGQVVVATDGTTAARLLPELPPATWRHVTCLYFAAPVSPLGAPVLALNGTGAGLVNNVAVMSDVAPGYAPPGQALVSVSVLKDAVGDDASVAGQVQTELAGWFGPAVREWRWLRSYRIARALPVRWPLERPAPITVRPGVWAAGDFLTTPSIQGAMESGEAVADAVLA